MLSSPRIRIGLRGVQSIREIQERLKKRVQETPKGRWIMGRGWNQERLLERRYPTRRDLDDFSRENTVVFNRVCGHICVVNSKALEVTSITAETIPPSGGQIDKDPKTGEPTGILRENAMDVVWKVMPPPSEGELMEAATLACQKAVEAG